MAVSKLTIADKAKMVRLYRETPASFSQIAEEFGISVSTVSRLLKEAIPEEEYRELVAQKQSKRPRRKAAPENLEMEGDQPSLELSPVSSAVTELIPDLPEIPEILEELQDIPPLAVDDDEFEDPEEDTAEEDIEVDGEEELDFLPHGTGVVKILPLEQAVLPDICYMVVDKAHEIVTRPLKAFKDLGIIPEEEAQSITVPIFDNHRLVRRFCHSHQLIIKFPSTLIHAAKHKLKQKGITRLLVSGQVYALP